MKLEDAFELLLGEGLINSDEVKQATLASLQVGVKKGSLAWLKEYDKLGLLEMKLALMK